MFFFLISSRCASRPYERIIFRFLRFAGRNKCLVPLVISHKLYLYSNPRIWTIFDSKNKFDNILNTKYYALTERRSTTDSYLFHYSENNHEKCEHLHTKENNKLHLHWNWNHLKNLTLCLIYLIYEVFYYEILMNF